MGIIFRLVSFLLCYQFGTQKNIVKNSWCQPQNAKEKILIAKPNLPHFLRAGDHLEIPVTISNKTDSELTGQVQLQLFDAETNQPVDGWFSNRQANQFFTAEARQNTSISFPIDVPYEYNRLLNYQVEVMKTASGKNSGDSAFADREEGLLPVLPNRTLITESIPLTMTQGGTKDFHFAHLLKQGNNESLSQHAFKIEFTSNPAWYAIEALPYLMESHPETCEEVFNRFFGNALGLAILNKSTTIRETIEKWKVQNPAKQPINKDFHSLIVEEIPWVLAPKTETQKQQYLAAYLDISRLKHELLSGLNKLESLQSLSGGFSSFEGEPEDRYLTQYITIGMGRLKKMAGIDPEYIERLNRLAAKSMLWLDEKMKEDLVAELKKNTHPGEIFLSPVQIQWFFMHSFFPEITLSSQVSNVWEYFSKKAESVWPKQNKMLQAMLSLWFYRQGKKDKGKEVLASFKKNATQSEEFGIYWSDVQPGIAWYQSVPETITVLIEAFSEINEDNQFSNGLKTWLISQKKASHWATTRATAGGCYALLFQQKNSFNSEPRINIQLGTKEFPPSPGKTQGQGFYSNSIFPPFIKADLGKIRVTISPAAGEKKLSPVYGAAYWQYFNESGMVKPMNGQSGPMVVKKSIFLSKKFGETIQRVPISENKALKSGDKLIIRIDLTTNRDLDYVLLNDNWASCMEPVDSAGGIRGKGNLKYYVKTENAKTSFIFTHLAKGNYVFEHEMKVTVLGSFSSGNATAECIYAPQFNFHTQSIKINVIEP
jgi:alpha-2-macroglobulin-like protein/alpha-2-macroglobulin family protein